MSAVETSRHIGTYADICKIYKISIVTAKRWRRDGIIVPVVEVGSVIRFDLDETARRLRGPRPTLKPKSPSASENQPQNQK